MDEVRSHHSEIMPTFFTLGQGPVNRWIHLPGNQDGTTGTLPTALFTWLPGIRFLSVAFYTMFSLTRGPFWYRFFEPQPFCCFSGWVSDVTHQSYSLLAWDPKAVTGPVQPQSKPIRVDEA